MLGDILISSRFSVLVGVNDALGASAAGIDALFAGLASFSRDFLTDCSVNQRGSEVLQAVTVWP